LKVGREEAYGAKVLVQGFEFKDIVLFTLIFGTKSGAQFQARFTHLFIDCQ